MKQRSSLRHIITISGKDSAATAIVQRTRKPDLPYEYLFTDVEMELPETYAWLDRLEQVLGFKATRIGRSLEDLIAEQGFLPSQQKRFCTKYGKVFPLRDYIGRDTATCYFGLRADEQGRAGFSGPANITACYPLVELGLEIRHVYAILADRGIMPPSFFWRRLWDAVGARADDATRSFMERLQPWDRDRLFAWRSRGNCFNCFYQQRAEWVGLLEHHPELFDRAEAIEKQWGSGDRRGDGGSFHWIQDMPLAEVRRRAGDFFEKRVVKVVRKLAEMQQGKLFVDEGDLLAVTSCGLFCGK